MSDGTPRGLKGAMIDLSVGRSFGLIEVTVVAVIIVVLTAVAAPIYHGYVLDAKTVEGKLVATSLWSAIKATALAACGNSASVSASYARAGLDSTGTTTSARWSVSDGGSKPITMDCGLGTIAPDGDVFTVTGTAEDVSALRVKLSYVATNSPPARLRCSADSGVSFTDC